MSQVNGETNDDLQLLQDIQSLISQIKQNFKLISDQFSQFLSFTEKLNKILSTIRLMQENQTDIQSQLEQTTKEQADIDKQLSIHGNECVHLDVGGELFTTTIQTLTQQTSSTTSNTFFTKLLAKKWRADTNTKENRIFIDRDGRLFDLILKYLRSGTVIVEDKTLEKELLAEAKYYKLQNLEDKLTSMASKDKSADTNQQNEGLRTTKLYDQHNSISSATIPKSRSFYSSGSGAPITTRASPNSQDHTRILYKPKPHPAQTASTWRQTGTLENHLNVFVDSHLLTLEFEEKLLEFIGNDAHQQQWELIYRATLDGFDASNFHRCCDSRTPTVSIIQTDFGNIFGGYTSIGWSSSIQRCDQSDPNAFLFTLKNMESIPPTKFPVAKEYEYCAVSHNPTCGPNFGSPKNDGSDLCLRGRFDEKVNCVFFPKSYKDTVGKGCDIFAKRYFACKEIEVFTIVSNT